MNSLRPKIKEVLQKPEEKAFQNHTTLLSELLKKIFALFLFRIFGGEQDTN